ncbi:MAG: hypothetical protein HY306_02405 [Nitrosomonadales bacterium]|nr:hypothetical protein [Nitrosomonadales bacterium]
MLFQLAGLAVAEPMAVTIVQSESSGPYEEFTSALREILLGRGISATVIDATQVVPGSGLVISVGMKAATAVAGSGVSSILNVLVPKAGYEKLLHDFPQRATGQAYSAVFLDQPLERQVRLLAAALPDRHRVGLLYSSRREGSGQLRRELDERGFSLHMKEVGELPLPEALQDLLKESDVLLALPDAAIYNGSTIRNILLATYRSGIPLVGFSSAYVKAGALCAVSSTPAQIARQAAALIREFKETNLLPAAQYPQEFEVVVNEQVARSLGMHLKSTSQLHGEIEAAEGGEP